jgi:hypothetical protein
MKNKIEILFSLYIKNKRTKSKMTTMSQVVTISQLVIMSQEELAKYFPTFINNSGLPINLETWHPQSPGLETMKSVLVKSGEQLVLPSTTGEWYLQTYLDKEFADEWEAHGFRTGDQIGKFRSKPCASGDYSWMDYDNSPFAIIYDKKNHTATFIKK